MNTIIIGCGSTVDKIYPRPPNSFSPDWYPYRHHNHKNCITVDINPICSSDILIDMTSSSLAEVNVKIGYKKFNLVVLENLPAIIFHSALKMSILLRNISLISTFPSMVFIPRSTNPVQTIEHFSSYGFTLKLKSHDFNLVNSVVSSFIGEHFEEYIHGKNNQNKLVRQLIGRDTFPYLLFHRNHI